MWMRKSVGKGRADAVVKTKDRIYVFEFKLEGTVDGALETNR